MTEDLKVSEDVLLKELNEGVLTLTFNRPRRKNAFNGPAWIAMTEALNEARENPAVACVVLVGAGSDFSSGMDLNDFDGGQGEEEPPFYAAQRAVIDFDKPLIGAAKGIAVGGGATLLLHCDVIYVGQSLRMRLPFVSLGLVPEFAASYMLQAIIGVRRANELFFTAEWINAERAVETGIATAAFDDEALLPAALAKAAEIAKWPVRSLQETKRCLKVAHKAAMDQVLAVERVGMDKLAMSPENIEAVTAIFEKRDPDFAQFR
jgi:enoyl-CoA hydratase/carnithine racemase